MPTTCASVMPTLREVIDVLESLESGLGYVRFQYVPQRKPRKSCPSVDAQRADTSYSAAGSDDPSLVRAFVPHGGTYEFDDSRYWIFENKAGETLVLLRSIDRRKALPAGEGYFADLDQGAYLWRSFLLSGIKLDTVEAVVGREVVRLFPNAPQGFRWGL